MPSLTSSFQKALPSLDALKPRIQPGISSEAYVDSATQYKTGSLLKLTEGSEGRAISVVAVNDQFLRWSSLKGEDFARSFGYEFIIYELNDGGGARIVDRMPMPLSPQSIQMDVPAATQLTVTMKGITEENNGAPIRPIRISGTTGMLPITDATAGPNSNTSNAIADLAAYAFRNTLRQVDRTIGQVGKAIAAFTGSPQKMSYLNYQPNEIKGLTTGYEFFHRLARFFDYYLAAKKQNRRIRMAFHMYKDQMYWDVSFQGYSFVKSAGSLEYIYNASLIAYRRRPTPDIFGLNVPRLSAAAMQPTQVEGLNALASIVNGIRQSKVALAQSFRVLAGIRADIESTFIIPVNELNMFVTNLANGTRQAVEYYRVVGLPTMMQAFSDAYYGNWKNGFDLKEKDVSDAAFGADISTIGNPADELAQQGEEDQGRLNGFAQGSVQSGQSVLSGMVSDRPADNTLNEASISQVLSDVNPDDLPLSDQAREAIANEDLRLSLLTPDDFRLRRDQVEAFAASISQSFGGGDSTFNRITGLPEPQETFRELGTEEVDILDKLNDILIAYDSAIRHMEDLAPTPETDYYSFWGDQARAVDIPFLDSASVFYAPVPHGASMESIAMTYLGDAQRWVEIAAVNGLKPPYIDEDGFTVPFSGAGAGNSATLAQADNLFIGQKVLVSSDTQRPSERKILTIAILSANEALVTLDGDPNLASFTVSDNAKISAFRPGTISSRSLIAIPSDKAVTVTGRIKTAPGLDDINGLMRIAKTDFLLSASGDLVVGSYGDIALASGLQNLIQAAIIKIRTPQMSLLDDPRFGNGVEAGTSVAELDARRYLDELNQAFRDDLRYEGLQAAKIRIDGVAMVVDVLVRVANTDVYLPVSTRVPI